MNALIILIIIMLINCNSLKSKVIGHQSLQSLKKSAHFVAGWSLVTIHALLVQTVKHGMHYVKSNFFVADYCCIVFITQQTVAQIVARFLDAG